MINEEGETEERIVMDEPVPMYLQIVKTDAENNKTVQLAGAEFAVWDCDENKWVEFFDTTENEDIITLKTNDKGELYTPQKLYAGEYIVYEITAPEGYALNEEWAAPIERDENGTPIRDENGVYIIDESKLDETGKHINVDKQALGVAEMQNILDLMQEI